MYISAAVSALILLPTFGLASTSTFNATVKATIIQHLPSTSD